MVKSERRPSTATLTKPTLLDTKLLGIFDMSTVSREHLLAIKNLVHSTPRCKCKPMTKTFLHCGDCSKSSTPEPEHKIPKMYNVLNRTYRIRTNVRQRLQEMANDEVLTPIPIIPAPCVTCGRSEQPERFHSHPSRVDGPVVKPKPELDKRKTVQKPVAMKFRSKTKPLDAIREQPKVLPKSPPPKEIKSPRKKGPAPPPPSPPAPPAPVPAASLQKSSPGKENVSKSKTKLSRWREAIKKSVQPKKVSKTDDAVMKQTPRGGTDLHLSSTEGGYKLDSWIPAPVSGGRTRKVICYLCSQEFGTAALPSHEAQCIQKYLKETTDSDTSLRNDEIEKEQSATTAQENWNSAWEITQASLVPCEYCDRKFLPARIEAHQKICASKSNRDPTKNKALTNSNIPQPGILCENCGKRYGSSSIAIHREQCAKKSQNVDQQPTPPPPQVSRKPSPPVTVICYICGRNFGTKSIGFHEPQCLKKWKIENDKLPPELQRPAPIKFEEDISQGLEEIDSDCQELFWKAHKAQLVPCSKCSRTFYPDRLEVHLKGCKGPSKNKPK